MAWGGLLKDKDDGPERVVPTPEPPPRPKRWVDADWLNVGDWLSGPFVKGRERELEALTDARARTPFPLATLAVRISGEGRVLSVILTRSSGDAELDRLLVALYDGACTDGVEPVQHLVEVRGSLAPAAPSSAPSPHTEPWVAPSWPVDWIDGPVVLGREGLLSELTALREAHPSRSVWLRLEVEGTRVTQTRVSEPSGCPAIDQCALALYTDAELAPSAHWTGRRLTAAQVVGRDPHRVRSGVEG